MSPSRASPKTAGITTATATTLLSRWRTMYSVGAVRGLVADDQRADDHRRHRDRPARRRVARHEGDRARAAGRRCSSGPDAQDREQHAEPDVVHVARQRREHAHRRERDLVHRARVDDARCRRGCQRSRAETAHQLAAEALVEVAPGQARMKPGPQRQATRRRRPPRTASTPAGSRRSAPAPPVELEEAVVAHGLAHARDEARADDQRDHASARPRRRGRSAGSGASRRPRSRALGRSSSARLTNGPVEQEARRSRRRSRTPPPAASA